MRRISTATRISLTLACLCLSLLFAAQTLGLIPDQTREILEGRKTFCKALAAQACWAAQKEDIKSLKEETGKLMEKNDEVRSVTILRANGQRPGAGRRKSAARSTERFARTVRRPRGDSHLQGASALGQGPGLLPAAQRQRLGVVVHRAGSADPVPDALHVSSVAALPEADSASSRSVLRHSRPGAFHARHARRRRLDHRHQSADRAGQQGVRRQVRPIEGELAGLEGDRNCNGPSRTRTRRFPGNWRSARTLRRSAPC